MARSNCWKKVLLIIIVGTLCWTVSAQAETFRFTASADNRPYDEANKARWEWLLDEMTDKVGDEGVFHIMPGDFDDPPTTDSSLITQFGSDVIWYPVVGNHEAETPADMTWVRDAFPSLPYIVNSGPPGCETTTYSFDYGNAHFVALNIYYDGTSDVGTDGDVVTALYDWLVADLAANTKPAVFVIGHEPAYPQFAHVGDSLDQYPANRDRFWKLLNDEKVITFFCGHTHYYSALQQAQTGDYPCDAYTWQVDCGNAGNPGEPKQTFVDVTVTDTDVTFTTWQGTEGVPFTVTESWTVDIPLVVAHSPSPANGAEGVSTSPNLEVTVQDPDDTGDALDVTFFGREYPSFTIVVLPDTQYYSESYPDIFTAQTQWIVDNVMSKNIVFVTHEGDIVQTWDNTTEWERANTSMSVVDGLVAYGLVVGNHDKWTNPDDAWYDTDTTYFNQTFPYTRYESEPWYGGHYGTTNDNSYQVFSAGSDDYIILHLEDYPNPDVITWADGVLKANPNRKAIITTHGYIDASGTYTSKWGSTQYIRDMVEANANVYFVLCGHFTGEHAKTTTVNGRLVHELLADYQERSNGGNGWLRIMRFEPDEDKVYVETYSPWLDQYETDADSQFVLDFDMTGINYSTIGTNTGVPSGASTSITWAGRSLETLYEWHVEVTDATVGMTPGPLWSFTTGTPKATNPNPANGATNVDVDADLSWSAGIDAVSHDVYFGTDPGNLPQVSTQQAGTTYDPDTLAQGTTYYWAIDEHDSVGGVTAGDVWSFTTVSPSEPHTEDFESGYTLDQTIGAHPDWYDGGGGPIVTSDIGVGGSVGLAPAGSIFTWTAFPFSWDEINTVIIGMDFQTDGSAHFDDDRIGWMISDASTNSSDIFGVQLDPGGSGYNIEGYWDGSTADRRPSIVNLPALSANAWYRLRAEFTRLTDTSAAIDVELWSLDSGGNPVALIAGGSIVDTSTLGSDAPHSKYFTATTIWPAYKNYTTAAASADNAYFEIVPVLQPPTANDDSITTDEDTSVIIDVLANDTDPDSDPLVVDSVTQPSNGTTVNNGTDVTYTPNENFNGIDTFTYTATDGTSSSNSATVTVTVNPINDAPVADARAVSVKEDTPEDITLTGSDVDGDELTYIVVTDPVNGALSGTAPDLTYTPTPGYSGTDSFTFKANDGTVDSDIATVSITVAANNIPVADDQSVTTDEDVPLAITLTGSDADSDPLTFSVVTGPANGTLSGTEPDLTYTPDENFNGADSFTFIANDGFDDSAEATVTIAVNALNDDPVAVEDSATTDEDTAVIIPVLVNDTDPEDDTLTLVSVTQGASGAVVDNGDGTVTYTPNENINGSDSFTYTVEDGNGGSAVGTVNVTVNAINDSPTADEQSVTTDEDAAIDITLTASDADGDPLTYSVVSDPSNGTLSGTEPNLTYTPDPDFNGSDSFTFDANDGTASSAPATISITVTSLNDDPVANDDSETTDEDTPISIAVLANDTDTDADSLSVVSVTQPSDGTAAIDGNNVTYTPSQNFNGSDSFTYTVSDGSGGTDSAAVNVTVNAINDSPTADNQSVATDEDTAVAITLTGSDPDIGDILTYNVVASPANGSLSGTAPNLTYTPNTNYNGPDSFTFDVNDGTTSSTPATVSITVNALNDDPVANDDTAATDEDNAVTIDVLANDTDADADSLSVISVTQPSDGTAAIDGNNVTYTPNGDFFGSDSFTYTADDGNGGSATGTVNVTVNSINDPPQADDDSAVTDRDVAVAIDVLTNDTDVEADTLTVANLTQPSNGSAAVNPDETVTYTPNSGYTGGDSFTYTANDGTANSNVATVSVTVNAPGPTTLFSDGFESGNLATGGWTSSGSVVVKEPAAYEGVYGVQMGGVASIAKAVSTVGFVDIHVKYARKTKGFDSGESLTVEWSADGTAWNVIESTQDTAWAQRDIALGAEAGENAAFSVRFRTNANKTNEYGSVDSVEIIGATAGPDMSAPIPNPMTWATVPYSTGETSIAMVAATASDLSGVEYYFTCTAGGGNDSGWQDSTSYVDTGLSSGTQYTYIVTARDKSPNQNETAASTAESATTDAPDTVPPSPDPMTWAEAPQATDSTSVSMTATTASDPSGVEYYFECTAGGGNDSGWQDSPTYEDTGLSAGTEYTYRVQARDKSPAQNTTGWSSEASATPIDVPPAVPTGLAAVAGDGQVTLDWADNGETDLAGYNVYRATASGGPYTKLNGALLTTSDYLDSSVVNDTTYYYVVTAVDSATPVPNESGYSSEVSATPTAVTSDVVTIVRADYRIRQKVFTVQATSSQGGIAELWVEGYETYGPMTYNVEENLYTFRQTVATAPGEEVTVTSSLGGSNTAPVTHK